MQVRKSVRMALLGATAMIGVGSALDSVAYIGTTSGNLNVTATVVDSCTFGAGTLAFGNYDPTAAATTPVTGTITVTCTSGDSIGIDLGQGSNAATGSSATVPLRQMKDGGTDVLAYTLFQPTASGAGGTITTTLWGATGSARFVYTATGASPETINVFGQITALQAVPAGAYTDTVAVTVNY